MSRSYKSIQLFNQLKLIGNLWEFVNLQDVERQPGMLRRVRQKLMRWSTSFWYFQNSKSGTGRVFVSSGWVITEELESCVCSSKWRCLSLYRRSGSERKRRITTTSAQANGQDVWNDPANERRGKFLSCVCPPPLLRPTVRPTDKHTNPQRPTRANGEPLLLPCGCGEKKSRVEKVRSVLPFFLLPNNLPAWDPKHKNNSDAGPCNIRREYRQWADASSHRQRQKMDFPSDILVSYNHTRNGLAKSYITPNPSAQSCNWWPPKVDRKNEKKQMADERNSIPIFWVAIWKVTGRPWLGYQGDEMANQE